MKILALELSTARGSLAWLDADVELAREWANDRKNSGAFFENLDHVTKQFGAPEAIVVGLGPGSYAGTRIAISAAIGLQVSSRARLIGFPSICAMESAEYCVIGDARRRIETQTPRAVISALTRASLSFSRTGPTTASTKRLATPSHWRTRRSICRRLACSTKCLRLKLTFRFFVPNRCRNFQTQ